MKKILFVVGSLREKSFNRQIAKTAASIIADRAEVSFLEYADVPFMNQDSEDPTPAAVAKVRAEVQSADGIWIFTPEYNFAVPGVLKNLLDWLSRPLAAGDFSSGTAAMGKKVTISGIGGKNETRSVRAALAGLLAFIKMEVIAGEGTGFAASNEAWTSNVVSLSDEDTARLKQQAETFLASI